MSRTLGLAAGTANLTGAARYHPYPDYKESNVEWLNEVPTHWRVERLKYVATLNDETLPESTDPDFTIEYIDIGSVDPVEGVIGTETLSFGNSPSRARRIVRHGDVIVSTVRTYLRAIAPIANPSTNTIVSTGFAVVRPRVIHPKFAFYLLRSPYFVERVVANSVGVGYPAINATDLASFPIGIPSMDEQRTIAAYLDRETARIDALVAKKERLIALLKEKRGSLVTQAVTQGLDRGVELVKSGVEGLQEIPKHWKVKPVWKLFELGRGRVISHEDIREIPGPYPVYSSQTEDDGVLGYIATYDYDGRYLTWTTDGANAGAVFLRNGRFNCTNVCGTLRPIKSIEGTIDYVCSALNIATVRFVRHDINPKLMNNVMAAIRVPFPPRDERKIISEFIGRETAQIDTLMNKVRDAIGRLKDLRTSLISAAVTGKIDVRTTRG